MNTDSELELWRSQWQSKSSVPLDLRRIVERQSRWMRIMLAADILVTVIVGGATLALAVRSPQPSYALLAGATWLFLLAAWSFSHAVHRGTWRPAAPDTAAFVELSIRRCRGRLAGTWFGADLYLVEIAFCLGWIYRYALEPRPLLLRWLFFGSATIDAVWLATGVLIAVWLWYRRKKQSELAWLLDLRRETNVPGS